MVLKNPFTGQTITFISEDDEVLVMESSYEAGAALAPSHLHPNQEERFVVLSGAVRAGVNGDVRTLEQGEQLIVPAKTPHEFGGEPNRRGTVRWEVRPPLRTREFLEGLAGALQTTADAQAAGEEPPAYTFDLADYGDVFRLP